VQLRYFITAFTFLAFVSSARASEHNTSSRDNPPAAATAAAGQDSKITRYAVIDTASGSPRIAAVAENARTGGSAPVTHILAANPKTGVAWTADDVRAAGFNTGSKSQKR
jgi:hypothetical protein